MTSVDKWKIILGKKHICLTLTENRNETNSRFSFDGNSSPFLTKEKVKQVELEMSKEISKDPFKHSSLYLEKDFNKSGSDYILSQAKIRKMITEIKNDLFLKQTQLIFNSFSF